MLLCVTSQLSTVITDEQNYYTNFQGKLINAEKCEYASTVPYCKLRTELDAAGITTMEKLYNRAISLHSEKKALGVREVLGEEEVADPSGKLIKKYELGDYKWKTFKDVDRIVQNLCKGLTLLNLKPKEKIAIFAETREEWFITSMAAFKKNLPSKNHFLLSLLKGTIGMRQHTLRL